VLSYITIESTLRYIISRPSTSLHVLYAFNTSSIASIVAMDFLWKGRFVRPLEALVSIQNTRLKRKCRSSSITRCKLILGTQSGTISLGVCFVWLCDWDWRAIAELKQRSVIGWVTKNLLSRTPLFFWRHVKPLVALAVVSTDQSALSSRGGLWPVLLLCKL
jgi:hypothetical protein